MALRIRLQKRGRTHRPLYKLVVAETSARRDGRFVEQLGNYNPSPRGAEVRLSVDLARVDYWLGVGARPTDTVGGLIRDARRSSPVSST
jgi:small subunit ribosomal protein S16